MYQHGDTSYSGPHLYKCIPAYVKLIEAGVWLLTEVPSSVLLTAVIHYLCYA